MGRRWRPGFSLVELLVALTLTLGVFAITLPFVRAQSRALGENAGRLDAEQLARYAQRAIHRELGLAAVDPAQPLLVYAGPMGIAFNANVLASDTTDIGALAVEIGAVPSLTEAWRVADAAPLPLTTKTYPTVDYTDASGAHSRNETISYFLHPDTVSDRADVYVLYRRVNARDSVQVVRGIHVPPDSAFFSYHRMVSGTLQPIPPAALPLFWDAIAIHDVRAVGVRAAGFFRNRQTGRDVIRTVYGVQALPRWRAAGATACARTPATPPDAGFTVTKSTTRPFRLTFVWSASPDDTDGSSLATHYVIERKLVADSLWHGIANVVATRAPMYRHVEYLPVQSGVYTYALRVLGCGGGYSATKAWAAVTLP